MQDAHADQAPDGNHRAQFARYLVAGGLAALANYLSRFVFSAWFPFEIAIVLAYAVGLCVAFVLMRRYAFPPSTRTVAAQVMRFTAVNGLAVLQTVLVSSAMLHLALPALGIASHTEAIAHAVGVAVPVVSSYFGHRHLSFR